MTEVPELNKPIGQKCKYCLSDCTIYQQRPISCKNYKCAWLQHNLTSTLRPDICHVIFERLIINPIYLALVDPEYYDSWKSGIVSKLIKEMINTNYAVAVIIKNSIVEIFTPNLKTKKDVIDSIIVSSKFIRGQNNGCAIIHNRSNTHT
jgi:hypothetical protein